MTTVFNVDCIEGMRWFPDNTFDSIVTDPPYELGFMGKAWDSTGIANNVEMWREALRVLKPGGHLLAFSGTRTYHRMTCAIEDAGFEIRDQIGWIYGSGFPKSRNLDGYWQGWGTALKPAQEPICVARKPLVAKTVASNVLQFGTGALNIDSCRIDAERPTGWSGGGSKLYEGGLSRDGGEARPVDGRWPANIIHDGSDEVLEAFAKFGENKGQAAKLSTRNCDKTRNTYGVFAGTVDATFAPHDPLGSAARFFYCAKASRADRDAGCAALEKKPLYWSSGDANPGSFQSTGTDKSARNNHPTVKPTALMRYLVRLVTPPGGSVFDPFTGSGSTGRAAALEGFAFIGFELDPAYCEIARARIDDAVKNSYSSETVDKDQ